MFNSKIGKHILDNIRDVLTMSQIYPGSRIKMELTGGFDSYLMACALLMLKYRVDIHIIHHPRYPLQKVEKQKALDNANLLVEWFPKYARKIEQESVNVSCFRKNGDIRMHGQLLNNLMSMLSNNPDQYAAVAFGIKDEQSLGAYLHVKKHIDAINRTLNGRPHIPMILPLSTVNKNHYALLIKELNKLEGFWSCTNPNSKGIQESNLLHDRVLNPCGRCAKCKEYKDISEEFFDKVHAKNFPNPYYKPVKPKIKLKSKTQKEKTL